MNFILTSVISLLLASVAQSEKIASHKNNKMTVNDYGCESSSSSSCCQSINEEESLLCKEELMEVEAQVYNAAVQYFQNLQDALLAEGDLLQSSATQGPTLNAFANEYSITIEAYNAIGLGKKYPGGIPLTSKPTFASMMRAQGLNKGVYVRAFANSYYSFQQMSSDGQYVLFHLIAPSNQVPLSNFVNIKRKALRNNCH